jgi:hypothetical protein
MNSSIFDEMLEVAHDEQLFQEKRLEIMDREIAKLPIEKQLKYRQMQWVIDGKLRGLTGITRYNKMVELFWQGFIDFQKTLVGSIEPLKRV